MSWRQYGGTNKTLINSVNVGSVVANQFLSRSTAANVNQFDNLKVKGQLLSQDYILSATYVKGLGQLVTSGNLIVKNQQFFGTDASFVDHLPWSYIFGNSYGISINNKNPQAVFHITGLSYEVLKIDTSMNVIRNIIGQNVNAKGIVIEANDTSSNIFFYNDISTNKLNIPDSFIKNNNGLSHGSGNSLFYLQKNGNILLDASSQIFINANKSPGTLGSIFINSNYTSLSSKSKFYLRNPTINTYNNTYNETVTIYDNSNSTYLYDNYNVNSALTGNALTLISYDNNSNTFLRLIDPSSKGLGIGGGAFVFDTTRSFGTIGLNDINGNYIPTQNIVSGNNNTKYTSTIGINTFAPKTENYVLDINGTTRIGNGEFKTIFNSNFEIKKVSYSKNSNYVLAIGSSSSTGDISNNSIIYPQYFSYSNNSGLTWNTLPINIPFGDFLKNSNNAFISVSAYNQNFAIIGTINNILYWTNNSGITWSLLLYNSGSNNLLFRNTTDIFIQRYNSVYRVFLSFEYPNTDKIPKYNTSYFTFDPSNPSDINYSVSDSTKNIQNYFTLTNIDAIPNNPPYYSNPGPSNFNYKINASDCSGQYVYFVGDGIIKIDGTVLSPSAIYNRKNIYNLSYNSVYVYNDNNIIAVGNNIISWTSNGSTDTTGSSWNDIQLSSTNIGNVNLQSIFIYDLSNAIAVGNNGIIIYSNNWKSSNPVWSIVPNTLLNSSGIASRINSTNNKLINIRMPSIDTFIILNVNSTYVPNTYTFGTTNLLTTGTYGSSKVFYAFYPNIFNRINNTVFELSGNMVMSGDININDGGQLISNNNTFYILNNNVKNIYIGNAYSTTIIPGSTYIGNDLSVNSRIYVINDVCMNSRLFVSNDVSLNSNFYVNGRTILNGDVSLNRRLFVAGDVSFNSRLFIVSDVSMSSRLFVSNDTSLNSNLYTLGRTILNGDVSLNSSLFVNGDVSFNSRLFINRDVSLNSNLFVGNDITVYGRLNVFQYNSTNILYTNVTTSNYTLIVAEDMSLNGRLTVNYDVSMNSRLFVDSDSSFNSNLYTRGRTINQGDVSMNSRLFVAGDVSMNSRLFVAGDVSMNSRLFGAGDVSFNSNLFVLGKTILQGDVSMNTRMFIPLIASDVSINGNLQLSQNMYIVGITILNGDVSMNSRLFISNDVSMNSRLFVSSDASFNGNTFTFGRSIMRGDISLNNRLFVNADASFNSNIGITGNITAYNKIFSTYYDTCANLFTSNPNGNGGLNYLNSIYIGDSASSINIGSSQGVVTNRTISIGSGNIPGNSTTNTIYIGGANDRLFIGGSITSQNFNLSSISIPVFILNSTQNDINGSSMVGTPAGTSYGSSFSKINNPNISSLSDISNNVGYMGAGFAIRDASLNTSGFFTVSCNGDGYYMKAPTSTNIIEFYLEGLKYSTNTNFGNQSVIKNGIMVLTTDRKITSSQNNPIVTYSVSVKPIDVSNIFLRDDLVNDPSFQRILTSVCVVGDLSLNKRLFVSGDVSMNSRLFVSNDVSFNSNFFTLGRTINQGDVSMNTRLFVSNDVSFNSNFFTLGRTIHQGDVSMNTRLFVSGDVSFNSNFFTLGRTINQGDVSMNTRLFVSNDVSFNSNFFTLGRTIHQGDVSMNTRLFVAGDVSLNSNFFTLGRTIQQGDVSINNRLFVSNDVSFGGNLYVANDLTIKGRLNVMEYQSSNVLYTNITTTNYTFIIAEDMSLNGRLTVTSDVSMNNRLFVSNDVSFNSNMFTQGRTINQGDVSMNTRLFVSNDVSFNSNFFTLGRTIHQGDVSLNTRLFVSNDVSLNANFFTLGRTINQGDVSMNTRLFVSNDVSFNSNFFTLGRTIHQGDVSINTRLFVGGDASFNSRVFITSDVSMNSRLFVSNDVSFNSNFFTLGRTIHQGDVSMNTRLFVGGDASFNSRVFITSDVSMNSRLFVSNDVSFGRNLFVSDSVLIGVSGNLFKLDVSGTSNFRGTVNPISLIDNSVLLSNAPNLDLSSNFGSSWNPIFTVNNEQITSIAMSATGQYQSATTGSSGTIYTSNNYGFTWTRNNNALITGKYWSTISVSSNGQYQSAGVFGGFICKSSNYGLTWGDCSGVKKSDTATGDGISTSQSTQYWVSIALSSSGQYQAAVTNSLTTGTPNYRGDIYISNNYGDKWNLITNGLSSLNNGPSGAPGNQSYTGIAISSTGQYLAACINRNFIYVSNSYGIFWTQVTTIGQPYTAISMSSSGQYITAVTSNTASGTASGTTYGTIFISANYGITWSDTNTSYAKQLWSGVSISSSGQYQSVISNNGSTNYSFTFSNGATIITSTSSSSTYPFIVLGANVSGSGITPGTIVISAPTSGIGTTSFTISSPTTSTGSSLTFQYGAIYSSNNYGVTWFDNTVKNSNKTNNTMSQIWNGIAMNTNGQYQTAVAGGLGGSIFTSITPYQQMAISNNLTVINGDTMLLTRLFVTNDVSFNSNMFTQGRSIQQGDVTMNSRLSVGGNVGIGTLTPLYKLDVNGNANISSTLNIGGIAYANGKIYSGGNASTYTIMASGEIKLLSSGFKHWSIYNQSGILSIQDTSTSDQTGTPGTNYLTFGATAGLLDVNNILALRNTSTVNYTQYSLLGFGYGGGSTYGTAYRWKIEDITLNRGNGTATGPYNDFGAQSKLIFSCKKNNSLLGSADDVSYYQLLTLMPGNISNTNTRFGGYVGIGTTSPNFSLSIEYSGTNNDSTTYKNNYGLEIRNNCTQATNTFYNPNLILFSDSNSAQGAIGAVREAQSRDYNSGLMFLTNGVGNTYGYQTNSDFTLSERMRITSDGKVGIGTSTPAGKLHLHEATGSIGTGGTSGSLTISHGNQGGASSIVFLSFNNQPTDYGYIRYLENGGDTSNNFNITAGYTGGTGERGRLEIGTENDNSNDSAADCLILQLSGGNTGIGKLQPAYILDVNGNVSATSYNATSDMRIKSNITTINGTFAVDVLRKLEPKKYSYIDTENDNDYSWGFIGQEIEKVFDYSVTKTKNHIPNVYDYADLSGDRIIILDTKNIKELLSESLNKEYPIRIKLFNKYKKKEITRTIDKIIDDNTFSIIEPITHKDLSGNKLFVYGEVVDDFYNVNYTSVFTLTTAAVKELDNQLQNALKVIDEQNKTIEMLKNDVSELKTLVNNLMHN